MDKKKTRIVRYLCLTAFMLTVWWQKKPQVMALEVLPVSEGAVSVENDIATESAVEIEKTTWQVTQDDDYMYFHIQGAEWLSGSQYYVCESLNIEYDFGTQADNHDYLWYIWNGHDGICIVMTGGSQNEQWFVKDGNNDKSIEGAGIQSGRVDGMRQLEVAVPQSYFPNVEFTISYCGTTLHSSQITYPDGTEYPVRDDGYAEEMPEIPTVPEDSVKPEDFVEPGDSMIPADPDAVYDGIVIDGSFHDWDAVAKTPVVFSEYLTEQGKNYAVAMVWDGEYIYLYYEMSGVNGAGNWDEVTWLGGLNSGHWEIVTDLGYTLRFQLLGDDGGSVAGVDGAQVAVNNYEWFGAPHMWEIAIPASELPAYQETVFLKIYQKEELLIAAADLQGEGQDTTPFDGIEYDGLYEDWIYYPHTTIGYTQGLDRQADAALYADGDYLYGHMKVTGEKYEIEEDDRDHNDPEWKKKNKDRYEKWLRNQPGWVEQERWKEDQKWWDKWIKWVEKHGWWEEWQDEWKDNTDWYQYQDLFSWMTLHIDRNEIERGESKKAGMGLTITPVSEWEKQQGSQCDHVQGRPPQQGELEARLTREFYILSVTGDDGPVVIGRLYITVLPSGCEVEWKIEIEQIAEYYGLDTADLRMFGMKFVNIGPEWIWTAGTDTAPWLGAILSGGMAAGAVLYTRRRRRKVGIKG